MGLKSWINFIKEAFMLTVLKNKGYSMIDRKGEDGTVTTYFKRIGNSKEVKIGKDTYVISSKKRMLKNGMPYYRFEKSAFGECLNCGKTNVSNVDSDNLTEIIKKTRLAGQNTTKSAGSTLYVIVGGLVGFLACWIIRGFFVF